jgi:hypothetical protein
MFGDATIRMSETWTPMQSDTCKQKRRNKLERLSPASRLIDNPAIHLIILLIMSLLIMTSIVDLRLVVRSEMSLMKKIDVSL